MANYKAIVSVSEAILQALRNAYDPEFFDDQQVFFEVFTGKKFMDGLEKGFSLFLYRIFPNSSFRIPAGRQGMDGQRQRSKLPVDLHFILTAWAAEAPLQQALIGWAMRVLEDTPILPAALLNAKYEGVFHPDENVELILAELSTEDMFRIWETITDSNYQISVPYVARMVFIESRLMKTQGAPVQQRSLNMGELVSDEDPDS